MALILKDRVKETSVTAGTGTLTLTGAIIGFQSFNAVVASGSKVYYTIQNTAIGFEGEFEVGVGTFTATTSLSRDTVLSSSNSNSLVNFSADPELQVFITQPAEEAVYLNQATGLVEVGGNGTNTVAFTNINTTNLTATTVTLTAGTISTNAANATDIVNKLYVDTIVAAGVHFHEPVRVESPINLVATYDNGTAGVGATLTNAGTQAALVIDGVTVVVANRVLIYEQTDATENGVYVVTNVGSGSTNWILTRSDDTDNYGIDSPNSISEGSTFFVQQGDTGAGETYTCNTVGTIVFGTTDITFVQISSAQIYSAGTGLSLTNTTFSIANTAVVAATYGNAGAVSQIAVNAQGQITSASNVSINASSITLGTLANDRTTANASNGASTIVLRDSNGSFAGNVITATDVNATNVSATTGTFTNLSGNGATLTSINASNITSGTINNAFTTGNSANSASTLVLRDANGSFGANIISASFSGDGSAISAINASNISSGTIANARTTAASANGASTIVSRDSGGNFSANTVTAAVIGDLSGGTSINASNIASGTIANARTTGSASNGSSTIVLRGASGEFAAGTITADSFSGNGSALTAINATAITTGTLDNARTNATSANGASTLVVRDANGSFAGNVITGTTGTFTNISGNGTSLTAINASNISSGTIDNARTTAASANGASTIVLRDSTGNFTANTGSFTSISGNVTSGAWNGSVIQPQFGGTGSANLTADNVILGNGASTVKVVSPGTSGNVLTSDGTTWISQAGGGGGAGTITRTDFTATASQTVFSVSYPVGFIDVYRNGVKLAIADFTATNGTSFTLATGANAGDIVQAEVFSSLNLYQVITTDTFSGNGVQTVFTMSVEPPDAASTLVAISGVVQAPANYGVSSTSLTFTTAPPSGSNNISVRYLGVSASIGNASTITSGVLAPANGGTGLTSPGTSGNVLTSNGTAWTSSAPAGGGQFFGNAAVKAIAYNSNTIGENLTVTAGNNGYSAGPITISSTFTVTVETGATWTVI